MVWNWFDFVLMVILLVTLILGIIKGFIRQIIGIGAVVVGLILAVNYYGQVSLFFERFIAHKVISNLLGFFSIFLASLVVGGILSWGLSKLMKGPLKFANHFFGGFLGVLKGVLISGVIVFGLLVFPVNKKILKESYLAPYCLKMTNTVVNLIPPQLKEKFKDAYYEIVGGKGERGRKV